MTRGLLSLTLAATCAAGGSASAIPVFFEQFQERYAGEEADAEFAAQVKVEKCNVCHLPRQKKKLRNEYGRALDERLDMNRFRSARLLAEPVKAAEEIQRALADAEAEKSSAGPTFGEMMQSGRLPGSP